MSSIKLLTFFLWIGIFSSCSVLQEVMDSATGATDSTSSTTNSSNNVSNTSYDETKQQLLMRYVIERDVEGVKKAVAMGANPNFGPHPRDVNFPLYMAIDHHHTDMMLRSRQGENVIPMIDFLRSKTTDLNSCVPNSCILKKMCGFNLKECKKAIEVWGLDASKAVANDYQGMGKEEQFLYLMDKGMDSSKGRNILHRVAYMKPAELRKALDSGLKTRINEFTDAYKKRFPLLSCVDDRKLENAKILLEYGADPNMKCSASLYEAIFNKDADMVNLLLANGVTTYNECAISKRKSALKYALGNGSKEIVDILVDHGAK